MRLPFQGDVQNALYDKLEKELAGLQRLEELLEDTARLTAHAAESLRGTDPALPAAAQTFC